MDNFKMALTRRKAEITIAVLHEAIQICLNDGIDWTTDERQYARIAYMSLNALRNSLHRFLVDKPKNTITMHKIGKHRRPAQK
jgi:hypothetical protein